MEMTLDMLLYFIRDARPEIIRNPRTRVGFAGVRQFFTGMDLTDQTRQQPGSAYRTSSSDDTQYLYITSLQELWENKDALTDTMTALAVRDVDLSAEDLRSFPCALILTDPDCMVPHLMNCIVDGIRQLTNWDQEMHIAVLEGKSIQEILNFSENHLMYPVIIFDAAFDVLAYSRHTESSYDLFLNTIQKGYVDDRVMSKILKKNIFEQLERDQLLVAPAAGKDDLTNIYRSFYSENTLLGYACVFLGAQQIIPGYQDMLGLFIKTVQFCLKRDYENRRYGTMMYETFLLNLMNPTGLSAEQAAEQIKNVEGLSAQGRFTLGVFEFSDSEKVPLKFVTRLLNQEMWNVKPFIYHDRICMLKILDQNVPADVCIQNWEKENIDRILNNYDYTFGISQVFFTITDLRYAYIQACAALMFREPNDRFGIYGDIYDKHLLSVFETEMPAMLLQPEFYLQIKEYDKLHKTDYRRTILTYLECSCNATRAAEKLFLHRNTVRNMIQFAEERWHLKITDPEIRRKLILSDLIDRYLESR